MPAERNQARLEHVSHAEAHDVPPLGDVEGDAREEPAQAHFAFGDAPHLEDAVNGLGERAERRGTLGHVFSQRLLVTLPRRRLPEVRRHAIARVVLEEAGHALLELAIFVEHRAVLLEPLGLRLEEIGLGRHGSGERDPLLEAGMRRAAHVPAITSAKRWKR